jgi:phosphatidate cytidylyltransferase
LLTRVVTGLVLAPVLVWATLWAPKAAMFSVLGLAAVLCSGELLRMYREVRPLDRTVGMVLAAAVAVAPLLGPKLAPVTLGVAPVAVMAVALLRVDDVASAARRAGLGVLSLGYVGVLVGVLVGLYQRQFVPQLAGPLGVFDEGRGALMATFVMVFMGDTGAYFVGKSFGRRKLHALVSPKKTVEGAIGGLAASAAGGVLSSWLLIPHVGPIEAAWLGAACGTAGQIGDLAESLFKRATDTKDSGSLLPGHGGMLDRVDGVLFGGAVVQAWLALR